MLRRWLRTSTLMLASPGTTNVWTIVNVPRFVTKPLSIRRQSLPVEAFWRCRITRAPASAGETVPVNVTLLG